MPEFLRLLIHEIRDILPSSLPVYLHQSIEISCGKCYNQVMIFVTGCAGFIGSHLCERLLEEGFSVTGMDNFDPFYSRSIKERNLSYSLASKSFRFVEMDIRTPACRELILDLKPEVVVHLAAMAGVRPSITDPGKYLDVNVNGTLNILEAIRQYRIENFVFASSSSVYGGNTKIPYAEADPVDCPVSPYAATKKMGELLIYNYHHLYKIPSALHRFFTVYGPRQRPEMAIHKFLRNMYSGKPLDLYGDGTTSRDYTYISDILDGLVASIRLPHSYEVFNLGNSYTISLDSLVTLLEELTGIQAKRNYLPMQPGDVIRTWSDIKKTGEMLGYHPQVPIEKGLSNFIDWYAHEVHPG